MPPPEIDPRHRKDGRSSHSRVDQWRQQDISAIARLENACWPPWLRKSEKNITTITGYFPDTQLLIRDLENGVHASLTSTRINWDGNPVALTTWDDIAGGSIEKSDYSQTYQPDGNTICIMSSAIKPHLQGSGIAFRLVTELKEKVAQNHKIKHLVGPFRPNGYGNYKLANGQITFAEYCRLQTDDNEPLDPWLRTAFRIGMTPIRVEEASMVVDVSLSTFRRYQEEYKPEKWRKVAKNKWECGETGTWHVSQSSATYIEPNLWGEIPIK